MPAVTQVFKNSNGNPPTVLLRINGVDAPAKILGDLVAAVIQEDVEAVGMFTVRLVNWDMNKQQTVWSDDERFAPGNKVEVLMGYVDESRPLMSGEITGQEPEFVSGEIPMLTVRGYDLRHRLLRGRQSRAFNNMKDSAIAQQVIKTHGLNVDATDTDVQLEQVIQHNQTDMEFLQGRARRIGYEIALNGETVLFRPRQLKQKASLRLAPDQDLLEFMPRLTSLTQVSQVNVRAWDPKQKAAIVGQAGVGSEVLLMSGEVSGPSASGAAFGQANVDIVTQPVFSGAEATNIAKGQFNEMALSYITGEGTCVGRTDLRAGTVLQIDGVGRRFSGSYYVTSTRHSYLPQRGYRTAFTVRRNAT